MCADSHTTHLSMHSCTKQAWFLINTSHILHVVLVCKAVGSTWEMFNGFGFLEKPKHTKKKSFFFFSSWGRQDTASLLVTIGLTDDSRESVVDDMITNEFRTRPWTEVISWIACLNVLQLVPFGFVTLVYSHLRIHGVINNEEEGHRAVLIFSLHNPLPFLESVVL